MSKSLLFVKTLCVSLVLVSLVIIMGCTSTPSGLGGTGPVTLSHSTTVSPLPSASAPASTTEQHAADIQLEGNVYGISSNPQVGLDTITFTLGLALRAPAVDLTRMKIAFSTPGSEPIILSRGTRESVSIFTATRGNYPITTLSPGDEVEISFIVWGVPAGSTVNIELKPSAGAALPISRTVPAMLTAMNNLG